MANWWDEFPQAPQTAQAAPSVMPPPQAPTGPSVFASPPQAAAPVAPPSVFSGGIAGIPLEVRAMMGMAGPEKALGPLTSFLTRAPIEIMGPDGKPRLVGPDQALGFGTPKSYVDLQELGIKQTADQRANANAGVMLGPDGKPTVNPFVLEQERLRPTTQMEAQRMQFDQAMRAQQLRDTQANAPIAAGPTGAYAPNPMITQGAVGKELATKDVDQLMAARNEMAQVTAGIKSIHTARELLDKGVITGSGANWRTSMGNALKTYAGVEFSKDAVANTQAYVASLAAQVAQNLQALRPATDKDVVFAQQMAGGQIELDEAALRKILDIGEQAAREKIAGYQRRATPYLDAPFVPPETRQNLRVEMPPPYQRQAAPGTVTAPMPGGPPSAPAGAGPWQKYGR